MKSSNGSRFPALFIALVFTCLDVVRGGNVLLTNFDESRGSQVPVSLANGTALLQGGSVQVGSFVGADPAVLINGLISPAGLAALLSNFVTFGPAASVGAAFSGLYGVDVSVPLNATSPLVGQSIYTVIGNATTLSTSSELAIIRHASLFEADAPVFGRIADISDPTATMLFGQRPGPSVTTALGAAPSLQLVSMRETLGVEDANGLAVSENATQSFGVVPPGTAVVREFRVRNQGGGALSGMAVQLDGLYVSSFRIDRTQLPPVLLPGASGTFTVTFNPVTSATKSATVSVVSSTPGFNVFSMPVSGTGDSYFLTPPVSRTVTAGQPVTFSAVAGTFDGAAPAYQWFRNGVALPGATGSTLTVSPAQPWHSGEYAVQVPGSAGSILSETANLRINGAAYGPWQGLVSYYPFDASPADAVRPASPAELINASQLVTDLEQAGVVEVVGRGFAIPPFPFEAPGTVGPGGYIRLPRPVSAEGEAFTFSFWLKEQGYSSRHGEAFLTLGEGLDSADVLGHYWIGGGDGVADYYGSMTDVVEPGRPGAATIDDNGVVVMYEPWTAWTLVARDGVMRVYRQGTYRGQVTYPVGTMGDFYIGRHWWVDGGLRYSTRLRARVNDVRVFNRALNDADVFQLYSQLSPPPEPGAFEAWSTAQGLTGSAAEASADPDRDGFTNLQEYSFGTIPRQSTPALSDFRVTAASSIIDWLARPDVQYGAYSSLDLVRWGSAPFPITAAPNQAQVPAGYQRLQLELPLLDRYEEIDLFTVRIEAEASPVFNPGTPVTLTPATGEAAPGEAISLSGPEAVNAISYKWYKNDVVIPGATRRTLELTAVTADQTGSYSLMALNAAGQTRTAARFLNVRSPLPAVVTTGPVMNITGSTALASGTISSDGGAAITSRGVVFSPAAQPTLLTGTPVSFTPGTGTFAAPLSPRQGKTTYYVRAFATTTAGTTYGSQVVFTTVESIPVVVTGAAVAGATFDTFTVSGEVTNDGGTPVTRRGIVYGLTATPALGAAMDAPAIGAGAGAFSSILTNLAPETAYYARAYATNMLGIHYGAEINFHTDPTGFSLIPEGVFTMGDSLDGIVDAPIRQVMVSAFYMAQHETTKELWDEVSSWGISRGYDFTSGASKGAEHPVHTVGWYDVIKWCNARSEKEGLTPVYYANDTQTSVYKTGNVEITNEHVKWRANGYRLPTEAEWEKGARGGLNYKRFPWGDTISHSQANYYSDSGFSYDVSPTHGFHPTYAVDDYPYTSPVGSFAANGYGLYDMVGNVHEWCWDWYGTYASGAQTDPKGGISGSVRAPRGGSCFNLPGDCRVSFRDGRAPFGNDSSSLGFRAVRSLVRSTGKSAPTVITRVAVSRTALDTVTVSGEVTNDDGNPVIQRGVVFSLTPAPTLATASNAPAPGSGTGVFTSNLPGLVMNATYYARAYATNAIDTGYGAEITFTAVSAPPGYSLIPEGSFSMGDALDNIDDSPVSNITVSAFFISRHETTTGLWQEVREWGRLNGYTNGSSSNGKASNHPIHGVSWYDVIKWCNARSEKEGLTPVYYTDDAQTTIYRTGNVDVNNSQVKWKANGYRLPTEAEWEKAARGGLNEKRFAWGDTISHDQANYRSDIQFAYDISPTRGRHPTYFLGIYPYTSPVGSFTANDYGLYDMTGNVWEWCWNWYGGYATGVQTDPKGSTSGLSRVFRGGSWYENASLCRAAYKHPAPPNQIYADLGFRVVRSLAP